LCAARYIFQNQIVSSKRLRTPVLEHLSRFSFRSTNVPSDHEIGRLIIGGGTVSQVSISSTFYEQLFFHSEVLRTDPPPCIPMNYDLRQLKKCLGSTDTKFQVR